jgi:hypothetical protein
LWFNFQKNFFGEYSMTKRIVLKLLLTAAAVMMVASPALADGIL